MKHKKYENKQNKIYFFFKDKATTEIYTYRHTLSLHDALPILALAASYLGATLVPLNTWYKQTELAWTLRHCGLKLLVSATRFLKADYLALLHTIVPEARGAAPGTVDAPDFPDLKSL